MRHLIPLCFIVCCICSFALVSCNTEEECPPTIFDHGIADDSLFYGSWRWIRTDVWESDNQGVYYISDIIVPNHQPFSDLPTLSKARIGLSTTLCLEEENNIQRFCLEEWKSSLSNHPSDSISNRVLSIYFDDWSDIRIRLIVENFSIDTVICPDFPFRVPNAASTDNYFVRENH